MSKIMRQTQHI